MRKHLRIVFITLFLSLFLFSCAGQSDNRSDAGRRQSPGGQSMPEPTEADLTLLRLQGLVENAEVEPELAVTQGQAVSILPILKEWKAAVKDNPEADVEVFTSGIVSELTKAQNEYLPGPPEGRGGAPGGEGDSRGGGQRPPSGGPGEMDTTSLLDELIETLSRL